MTEFFKGIQEATRIWLSFFATILIFLLMAVGILASCIWHGLTEGWKLHQEGLKRHVRK